VVYAKVEQIIAKKAACFQSGTLFSRKLLKTNNIICSTFAKKWNDLEQITKIREQIIAILPVCFERRTVFSRK